MADSPCRCGRSSVLNMRDLVPACACLTHLLHSLGVAVDVRWQAARQGRAAGVCSMCQRRAACPWSAGGVPRSAEPGTPGGAAELPGSSSHYMHLLMPEVEYRPAQICWGAWMLTQHPGHVPGAAARWSLGRVEGDLGSGVPMSADAAPASSGGGAERAAGRDSEAARRGTGPCSDRGEETRQVRP